MILESKELKSIAVEKEDAVLLETGSICVKTGKHTGRSPNAKFIVRDKITEETVDWTYVNEISIPKWKEFSSNLDKHIKGKQLYTSVVSAGHSGFGSIKVKVHTELAWHSLFARNMFSIIEESESTEFDLFYIPSFHQDPIVLISFEDRKIIISGTKYAGEMKKSVFTILNHLLPERGILPMHASVNLNKENKDPTIFFGLSGTGKTTLSADVNRNLIGDDEHGWSSEGVFNFEGGCYAKVINLSKESEPLIYQACKSSDTVLENVVLSNGKPDFFDDSITANTRASYPLSEIINSVKDRSTKIQPKNIVFLTCDAFGVLPAIAKLDSEEAKKFFTVGYTSKVAGTESGISEPVATFSPCFGLPFMTRRVEEYANMLKDFIEANEVTCWMLNTGWTNGPYGVGERIPLEETRTILEKIYSGELEGSRMFEHSYTGLTVPLVVDVNLTLLKPELGWEKTSEYEKFCKRLIGDMFGQLE